MNIPGGITLSFRKKILKKLIELEQRVMPFRKQPLISDEELTFIQERWIEEGENELSVFQIARHREFKLSNYHKEILECVLIYKKRFYKESKYVEGEVHEWFPPYWDSANGLNVNADARYYAQLSVQLKKGRKDPIFYAKLFTDTLNKEVIEEMKRSLSIDDADFIELLKRQALELINSLPVNTKQYYPSSRDEEYIRWEWREDRVGVINVLQQYERGDIKKPKPTLFGYEGEFGIQFEQIDELYEKGDILECESISLQDKMAFLIAGIINRR